MKNCMWAMLLSAACLTAPFAVGAKAAEAEHAGAKPTIATPVIVPRPAVLDDIRSLFALQDRVAAGHQDAAKLQKAMLARINGEMSEAVLKSQPNVLAPEITGYLLSGGDPRVAEMLAEVAGLEPRYRPLLKGAVLYTRGSREEAEAQLRKVDALLLPPQIGGRVALAQAMLATENDFEKQRLLMIAAAAMPGSLIEESALRRSALAYAESGNQKAFWVRAERYGRRFPRSLYAAEFMHEVVVRIVRFEASGKKPDLPRLDRFLGTVNIAGRRRLYLGLARQAALKNLAPLTAFAAKRLRRISAPDSAEAQLASLYDSLFEVASGHSELSLQNLAAIDPRLLPLLERGLLAAGIAVARQIQDPVATAVIEGDFASPEIEKSSLEKRAELILAQADQLIRETQ